MYMCAYIHIMCVYIYIYIYIIICGLALLCSGLARAGLGQVLPHGDDCMGVLGGVARFRSLSRRSCTAPLPSPHIPPCSCMGDSRRTPGRGSERGDPQNNTCLGDLHLTPTLYL